MEYRIEFTQKKIGTFLVAALAVDGANRNGYPEVVRGVPHQSVKAFIDSLESTDCIDEVKSALLAAASRAANQSEVSVLCGPFALQANQLATLGLSGSASVKDLAVA